jgi:hypothetical protein
MGRSLEVGSQRLRLWRESEDPREILGALDQPMTTTLALAPAWTLICTSIAFFLLALQRRRALLPRCARATKTLSCRVVGFPKTLPRAYRPVGHPCATASE